MQTSSPKPHQQDEKSSLSDILNLLAAIVEQVAAAENRDAPSEAREDHLKAVADLERALLGQVALGSAEESADDDDGEAGALLGKTEAAELAALEEAEAAHLKESIAGIESDDPLRVLESSLMGTPILDALSASASDLDTEGVNVHFTDENGKPSEMPLKDILAQLTQLEDEADEKLDVNPEDEEALEAKRTVGFALRGVSKLLKEQHHTMLASQVAEASAGVFRELAGDLEADAGELLRSELLAPEASADAELDKVVSSLDPSSLFAVVAAALRKLMQ